MFPGPGEVVSGESGIHTTIRQYAQHLPAWGVEFVDDLEGSDVIVVHAGVANRLPKNGPLVAMLHGLYWSEDHNSPPWEYKANESVIETIRHAREVTVPSPWVNETLQRDMRFSASVIPHGVDWDAWQHPYAHEGYVLGYAKNRADSDVCDPSFLTPLALALPDTSFVATFARPDAPGNVYKTDVIPYAQMKEITQKAEVFISPIKETFGLHALEALAAGVPVLSPNYGGVVQFVQHGVNGYLYDPDSLEDMVQGLEFCKQYRPQLSANARELSRSWTWEAACEALHFVLVRAAQPVPPTVGWVIPYYNKPLEQLERAIDSLLVQTHNLEEIVVVDDGSDPAIPETFFQEYGGAPVLFVRKENGGVAQARNTGATRLNTKYIGFLDADDWVQPEFTERCVKALEADNSLHLAYTKLRWTNAEGKQGISEWPTDWNYDRQITPRSQGNPRGHNQIPTANLMRRETFVRLGGYRSRYEWRTAEGGSAGAEDADLWTRWGAYGYKAALVTAEPLFEYSQGTGNTSRADWKEATWLEMYPWVTDGRHPFGSYATPKRFSHPVRQYDEPTISVIIPLGHGHEQALLNALDSLDSQTYRKWEVIVVDDTGLSQPDPQVPSAKKDTKALEFLKTTFPHVRWLTTPGKKGPGYARNRGVEAARGQFVVFLDADDNLRSDALSLFLRGWGENEEIMYSDYVVLAHPGDADELARQILEDPHRQMLSYDAGTNTMAIRHNAAQRFDPERAQSQPPQDGEQPYVPCLVTTLIPRAWHNEIGGFDEKMPSWEDVDYYWRLARSGKCLARIAEPLVVYRLSTGNRRMMAVPESEAGRHNYKSLLEYLTKKYEKEPPPVPCSCGSGKSKNPPSAPNQSFVANGQSESGSPMTITFTTTTRSQIQASDNDIVMGRYTSLNVAAHRCIGNVTKIEYGHRGGGEQFYVHKADVYDVNGRLISPPQFAVVQQLAAAPREAKPVPPPPPVLRMTIAAATPVDSPSPLQFTDPPPADPDALVIPVSEVKGIGETTTARLKDMGIATVTELVISGEPTLVEAGLPKAKAKTVFAEAILLLSQTSPQPA